MTDIENDSEIIENNEPEPDTDIAGNIQNILMKRFDNLENKLLEMSKPVVKKKRELSEKQKLGLEEARKKKMQNVEIRKALKEQNKKELKAKAKTEVQEYRQQQEEIKNESIIKEDVPKDIADLNLETISEPTHKSRPKFGKTNNNENVEFNTYENQPNNKIAVKGLSGRQKMKALFNK